MPHDLSGTEDRRALVALSLVPGLGAARVRSLVDTLGSAAQVLQAPSAALSSVAGVGPRTAEAIQAFQDFDLVDQQFERAAGCGATLLTLWDEGYPPLLREIYDPPLLLWMRGALAPGDQEAIAVVGTRRASSYGKRQSAAFARQLAEQGLTVVSGLAYGIDKAAHEASLDAGGRTLAVLGSGVDRIYPTRHAALAERIVAHGAVLSEYPLGTAPDAVNFPRRNRIISGLSLGTLVVEAFETGGALITARVALEQNREVFALPSALGNAAGEGTNRLIQRGHAKLVVDVEDLLIELGRAGVGGAERRQPRVPPPLNGIERTLYEALSDEPIQIDRLCDATGLDPSSALVYLLSLEFKGLVRQMAGKQFFLA